MLASSAIPEPVPCTKTPLVPGRPSPRRAWLASLALGCFGVVAAGMIMQQLLNLAPCPLCIFQRFLYLVIGLVALLGTLCPLAQLPAILAAALLAALGFGIAAWQSWMQAYPHLAPTCSFTDPTLIERFVYWLGAEFPGWFLATGLCTSREWELFGLSIANWSVLVFAGLLGFLGILLRSGKH